MNCELVEERLSAYLDNMLVPGERQEVTVHLQSCPRCMMLLAELRQNDILLAQLPRVSPHSSLRQRLFSSPELLELVGTTNRGPGSTAVDEWTRCLGTRQLGGREVNSHPHLVSLPGGRTALPRAGDVPATPPTVILHPSSSRARRRGRLLFSPLKLALTMIIVAALGTAGLFGLSLHRSMTASRAVSGVITPPAAGPMTGQGQPLAAGTRFVFLRDEALWSTLADGSDNQPERLTPTDVDVGADWVVSPRQTGHTAGDLLAYIDLNKATLHTIRSDGQLDERVAQTLLKAGVATASVWKTPVGQTILNSLAWSPDGSLLAFVAASTNDGQTSLYLYSPATSQTQRVPLSVKGSVSRPAWSPDSARLAFEVTHNGLVSILDYNVQDQGVLELTNLAASQGNNENNILSLGWSPSTSEPAVTWSLGVNGHVNSVWMHHVGEGGTPYPEMLAQGTYMQALYSPNGDNGIGSWLIVGFQKGQAGDIWRMDLTHSASMVPLSMNRQVSQACWSPDGSSVFYIDQPANGLGSGYIVNVATGKTVPVASAVAVSPLPVWSADGQQLAYSTGMHVGIMHIQKNSQVFQLHLEGEPIAFSWSPVSVHQLIVSLSDVSQGLYLVNTATNTLQRLDSLGTGSQIQWTEIP